MSEPGDLWHVQDVERHRKRLAAKGLALPKPCGCRPAGQIPTADHGKAMRWRASWRDEFGKQRFKEFPDGRKQSAELYQEAKRTEIAEKRDPVLALVNRSRRRSRPELGTRVPTVAEYVELFIEQHERRKGTVEAYASRLRTHVVPAFGDRPINSVKRAEYRAWFARLKRSGMPDTTRTAIRKALSAMLSVALEDEVCQMDGHPIAGLVLSQETRARETAELTWAHVVAIAENIDPRYELLIWFGALQGLRAMEAAGVRKVDVLVEARVQLVEEQRQDGEAVALKTKHSRASLAMGSFLIDKYTAHLARWRRPLTPVELGKRERRGLPPIKDEHQELVTLSRYSTPLQENGLSRAFNLAVERARARGVDVPPQATFRDLRHFCDAVLVASGLDPRKVQARLRHARLAETLDTYGYLVWRVDWENAPASFTELYGIEAPAGLPAAALVPMAERQHKTIKGVETAR